MRTQKFQRVFDRVVRKLGRDPLAEVNQDMARTILDHINDRVEQIHQAWDWPEWTLTEERAFRPIWNSTHQWLKINQDGVQDEVFYLGDSFVNNGPLTVNNGYYRVKSTAPSDPPIGTAPTNTTYWESMDITTVDTYIAYDQTDQRPIGRVIGAYSVDPSFNGCCGGLWFRPTEKGVSVRGSGNPTAFITYLMPLPEYSIVAYSPGRTYNRGEVIFYPLTGECYQAIANTATIPSTTDWRWVPFLQKWATFVVEGAYSDCLTELDPANLKDVQAIAGLASAAEARAMRALEARVDELTSQGQVPKYSFCQPRCYGWLESIAFTGGTVTKLTQDSQEDAGWVYPTPIVPQQGFFYYPDINSLKTTAPTLIATVPTKYMATSTIIKIFTGEEFRLDAGTSSPAGDPGQGDPADYDLATNNRHWRQVL